MGLITKIMAGVLLGIGLPVTVFTVSALNNPEATDTRKIWLTLYALGLTPIAISQHLISEEQRRSRKQQEEHNRLQSTFFKLLKQGDGRITALGFAMETGLTGAMAKAYLDERAEEFTANFDVDEEGNMSYRFNLGGISSSESSASNLQQRMSLPQKQRLVAGQPIAAHGNFDVILEAVPGVHKIAAIKLVRELTGLGLKEAKELVEAAPMPLTTGVSAAIAQQCKKQLEAIGATVMVIEN